MNYFSFILGAVSIIVGITLLVISIKRTPTNLRGYYGAMFGASAIAFLLFGIASIAFGFYQLA